MKPQYPLFYHLLLLLLILMMALPLHPPLSSAAGAEEGRRGQRRLVLHPVVLIPGNGGNQLEARLTSEYEPSSLVCRLNKNGGWWFRLWFDPAAVVLRGLTRCFAERMTLRYDPQIDDYRNAPGVDTRVPYFGSARGIRYLDPHLKHLTEYMATLVSSLEQIGYKESNSLFGAPYDFRYGLAAAGHPSQVGAQYLSDLKELIESAAAANGGRPAILVAHSLGGLFALQLLIRSPPSWRRRFVAHLVSLSTPWAGTAEQMLTFASGNALGLPLVDPLLVRAEQRSSESNLWLLPAPKHFGAEPIVHAAHINKSYSAFEMPSFLEDIGFREGVGPYTNRVKPLTEKLEEPGVPVTCVVGTGVDTPEKLFYRTGGFDERPEVAYGDGDGTVNAVSLLALESEWSGSANQSLNVIRLRGISHTGILKNGAAIKEIIGVINGINSERKQLVR
ncbi:lecithin-cholesterol acyltransferase-like 1 [Ananas comosus]|uniref:Lecithin-cholesterol acyltransferase-like 1 n=1 Tax=Ananas comosus TaxID=4615 RepID=A0A6P5EK37_ANACO|nr:lecithin-cholesterol acyltransferase-like 1 [Ananas comosus]